MKSDHEITAVEGLDYLYSLLWTGKLRGRKVNRRWAISERAVEERAKFTLSEGAGIHGTTSR